MTPATSRTICIGSWYWRRKACQRDSVFASSKRLGPWRSRRSAASVLVSPSSGSTWSSWTVPSRVSTCQTGGASGVVLGGGAVVAILGSPLPQAAAARRWTTPTCAVTFISRDLLEVECPWSLVHGDPRGEGAHTCIDGMHAPDRSRSASRARLAGRRGRRHP